MKPHTINTDALYHMPEAAYFPGKRPNAPADLAALQQQANAHGWGYPMPQHPGLVNERALLSAYGK